MLCFSKKKNVGHNRDVLYVAFATDPFIAYDQFLTRNLILNETECLLDRPSLAVNHWFACAFVAGLPEQVRQLLLSLKWMHWMSTNCKSKPEPYWRMRLAMKPEQWSTNLTSAIDVMVLITWLEIVLSQWVGQSGSHMLLSLWQIGLYIVEMYRIHQIFKNLVTSEN